MPTWPAPLIRYLRQPENRMLPAQIAAYGFRAVASTGLMAQAKPAFNTIVTNVPGPQQPLYLSGARLVHSMGAGPLMDGMGLFHVVSSYAGRIAISVQSCREMMPDPQFYQDCLFRSMAALTAATIGSKGKSKSKPKAKTKAKTKAKAKPKAKAKAKPKTKAKAKTKPKPKSAVKGKPKPKTTSGKRTAVKRKRR